MTRADVAVIGDGPAGSALAAVCSAEGVDVVLIGDDADWIATYGVWADEIDGLGLLGGVDVFARRLDRVAVDGLRRRSLPRMYGVVDNDRLRRVLRVEGCHLAGRARAVRTGLTHHTVELADGGTVRCRLVVDAAGWPARFASAPPAADPPWQTALGVVLPAPPTGALGEATLMDFRPVGGDDAPGSPARFVYALPVSDGWLVEETVLAASPAIDPERLWGRLAARLAMPVAELRSQSIRTEHVHIPMGGSRPARDQPVVSFGAAAGYVNPATGYSLATSLRAAGRVGTAISEALGGSERDLVAPVGAVWDAVWPRSIRRTRALHEYGAEVLARLEPAEVRTFFDLFFQLPVADWSAYLRADAEPIEVSRVMTRLFRSAPWALRRRLAGGNPSRLARLLRP